MEIIYNAILLKLAIDVKLLDLISSTISTKKGGKSHHFPPISHS